MAETSRVIQTNVVTFQNGWSESDEEGDYLEAYPVAAKRGPGRPKRTETPYEKPRIIEKRPEREEQDGEHDELFEEEVRKAVNEEDVPMREATKKLRKSKKYDLNVWDKVKEVKIPVEIGELAQIPAFRQQIRNGISNIQPKFEITEINAASMNDDSEDDKDPDRTAKTSAYSQCQIEGHLTPCIIDTGAGGCLISKAFLDKIGWHIEKPTKQIIVVADGHSAVPLGRVSDLPVQFGRVVIPTSAIVVNTTSYDLILGNNWLKKAGAIIDIGARKMLIKWKGRKYEVPIDDERGIRPKIIDESSDDENYDLEINTMTFMKLRSDAKIPKFAKKGDAGMDLSIVKNIELPPGESTVVGTGVAARIPEGHYGQIKPRSSLAVAGVTTDGGVIDEGYRGEIKIILVNRSKVNTTKIFAGDRVAQLVIIPIWQGKVQEASRLDTTERGTNGFGSTGVNAVIAKKIINETTHQKEEPGDKQAFKIGENTNGQQKEIIRALATEFQDVFATSFADIKLKTPKYFHDIDTGDHPPIRRTAYRTPEAYKGWQRKEIKDMVDNDLARPSKSPWGFPNVIAPKKGTDAQSFAPRMCTDFRPLNDITVKDAHPIPLSLIHI